MVESLGLKRAEGMDSLRGTWSGESGEWRLEGSP